MEFNWGWMIAAIGLEITLIAQVCVMAWWAARLTHRVETIEGHFVADGRVGLLEARHLSLDAKIDEIGRGVVRLETAAGLVAPARRRKSRRPPPAEPLGGSDDVYG